MGQKTNPKIFRLITTQNHLSQWSFDKKNYLNNLKEDYLIRLLINNYYKNLFVISEIKINRFSLNDINVTISILYPRYKKFCLIIYKKFKKIQINKPKFFISTFIKNLNLILIKLLSKKTNKNYKLNFKLIKNNFNDVNLIAKFIGDQLKQRIPFRRIINQIFLKIKQTNILGLKIKLSGRLNGIEIARSEWKREGRIPLHTLNTKINYTYYFVKTIYGIIGIKIWLFVF